MVNKYMEFILDIQYGEQVYGVYTGYTVWRTSIWSLYWMYSMVNKYMEFILDIQYGEQVYGVYTGYTVW